MILADVARRRLMRLGGPVDLEHSITPSRYAVTATLRRACYVVEPGLMRLKQFTPDRWPPRDHLQFSRHPGRPLFDASAALDEMVMVSVVTLEAKKHVLYMEHEVFDRVPVRIDRSGKWKRHPPSKRKRMRSWRYASNAEKLRYAPLAKHGRIPWGHAHPDANRCVRLGSIAVRQEIFVYAQTNAPIEELFERYSDEWCGKITEALRC